ncbi:hypothetical protein CTI12_AA051240 [Artemisia annua]|uniref:ABC transporter domain-containing protein n=1 Tax=Artemisia annua TaxID=35608 RepID=A0A2U1QBN6_ARTAN|nr:hypothetical protein CTI12_AA051240 [Artemisia annua]
MGQNCHGLHIMSWMGLVSQEPMLFNDTIRANISYGKDGEATKQEIIAASELANAHKFISALLQGYDTLKQRVTIARVIVKSPKILLLDEATSALDAESERVVHEALDEVMVNRTAVVVAHRLSTIKGADVITVVKNGMGLVSQEPMLFNDTIRANISYGKDGEATKQEIIAASELANAHKFISALLQGYDTLKQRVTIARVIVKSPKILLLDEATSALDAESERVVHEALDEVMVNRTAVVVAHRLSTIKGADVITVVKNGVII